MIIEAYTDANWAGSIIDRQSTSGYCTFVGGNWLHGRARNSLWLPNLVQRQNLELSRNVQNIMVENTLDKLGFDSKDSMRLYCDNKAAISIANNPVQRD
jgi:hypothetical protein